MKVYSAEIRGNGLLDHRDYFELINHSDPIPAAGEDIIINGETRTVKLVAEGLNAGDWHVRLKDVPAQPESALEGISLQDRVQMFSATIGSFRAMREINEGNPKSSKAEAVFINMMTGQLGVAARIHNSITRSVLDDEVCQVLVDDFRKSLKEINE